jgi:hypothetical protein
MLLQPLPDGILKMFDGFGVAGYKDDIAALWARQPELLRLSDWHSAKSADSAAGTATRAT